MKKITNFNNIQGEKWDEYMLTQSLFIHYIYTLDITHIIHIKCLKLYEDIRGGIFYQFKCT